MCERLFSKQLPNFFFPSGGELGSEQGSGGFVFVNRNFEGKCDDYFLDGIMVLKIQS